MAAKACVAGVWETGIKWIDSLLEVLDVSISLPLLVILVVQNGTSKSCSFNSSRSALFKGALFIFGYESPKGSRSFPRVFAWFDVTSKLSEKPSIFGCSFLNSARSTFSGHPLHQGDRYHASCDLCHILGPFFGFFNV